MGWVYDIISHLSHLKTARRLSDLFKPLMFTDFKCLSVNIRGLNKSFKHRVVFRWLDHQHSPFVFLQETYSSDECENIWQAEWGDEVFFSYGTKHSKGTMILINPKTKRSAKLRKKFATKAADTLYWIFYSQTSNIAQWLLDVMARASETLNGCDVPEWFRTIIIEHATETYW